MNLSPCPLCGGEAELRKDVWGKGLPYAERQYWSVVCVNADDGLCILRTRPRENKYQVISRWNRRTKEQP